MGQPVDSSLGVQCLHCVFWAYSKRGQKILIRMQCLQNTACKCLPPADISLSGFLSFLKAWWAGIGRTILRFREVLSKMRGITTAHKL